MRTSGGKLALVLALAVMLSIPLVSQSAWAPPSGEDPVEPVTSEVTAYGFIANLSDQEENTPLQGVQVTLYDSDKNVVQVTSGTNPVKTDANGRFEFTFMHTEGDTYYMTFEYPGYTVRSLPDSMDMDAEGFVSFDPAETAVDSEGDYALSGESGGLHAIVMAVTTGSVYGTVQGESGGETFALSGATVTIVSEDGMSYSASTGANGYFSIDCPSGRYTMTVSDRRVGSRLGVLGDAGPEHLRVRPRAGHHPFHNGHRTGDAGTDNRGGHCDARQGKGPRRRADPHERP